MLICDWPTQSVIYVPDTDISQTSFSLRESARTPWISLTITFSRHHEAIDADKKCCGWHFISIPWRAWLASYPRLFPTCRRGNKPWNEARAWQALLMRSHGWPLSLLFDMEMSNKTHAVSDGSAWRTSGMQWWTSTEDKAPCILLKCVSSKPKRLHRSNGVYK